MEDFILLSMKTMVEEMTAAAVLGVKFRAISEFVFEIALMIFFIAGSMACRKEGRWEYKTEGIEFPGCWHVWKLAWGFCIFLVICCASAAVDAIGVYLYPHYYLLKTLL